LPISYLLAVAPVAVTSSTGHSHPSLHSGSTEIIAISGNCQILQLKFQRDTLVNKQNENEDSLPSELKGTD
jgi:hypothetical protein